MRSPPVRSEYICTVCKYIMSNGVKGHIHARNTGHKVVLYRTLTKGKRVDNSKFQTLCGYEKPKM